MSNFNEVFRKNVSYNNIKSHKKAGLYPLSQENAVLKKTQEGVKLKN